MLSVSARYALLFFKFLVLMFVRTPYYYSNFEYYWGWGLKYRLDALKERPGVHNLSTPNVSFQQELHGK